MVVSIGNRRAGDRDEMGFLLARQRVAVALLLFVEENRLQSSREVPLSHPNGGIARDAERFADLGVAPALGGFEQRMGTGKTAGIGFSCMEEGL